MFEYAFYKAISKIGPAQMDIFEYTIPSPYHHNGYELDRIFNVQCEYASTQDVLQLGHYSEGWTHRVHKKMVRTVLPIVQRVGGEKTARTWWRELSPLATYYRCDGLSYDPEIFTMRGDIYFAGGWQTEKYFAHIREELLRDFAFIQPKDSRNAELAEKVGHDNSIGVHVRRGDYVGQSHLEVCDAKYYKNAMKKMNEYVEKPVFYIFSDDIAWCKKIFNDCEAEYIDWNVGESSFRDMELMALCKHNIIANSTFSWWAAWLNQNPEKIVIAPRRWMHGNQVDYRHVVPESWIKLEN